MVLTHWLMLFRRRLWLSRYRRSRITKRSRPASLARSIEQFEDRTLLTAPHGLDDNYYVETGGALTVVADGVLANDGDADLDPLTAILEDDAAHGTLSLGS